MVSDAKTPRGSARYANALTPDDAARHPAYAALGTALSRSDVALSLLDSVSEEQQNPMLIFAALHYVALKGHRVLSPLYASLAVPGSVDPESFAATVIALVESDPTLVSDQLHRRTQTNEVGRSAVLRAVLTELHRRGLERVNIIDVGASAGLNLYLDHYGVYDAARDDDPLALECQSLSGHSTNGPLPAIAQRIGIDLNPLDPRVPDDALWLRACLWPEDPRRMRRLEAIMSQLDNWEPTTLLQGTALDRLGDALALADESAATVLWHTWALAYFPPDQQRAFGVRMRELAAAKVLTWVSVEWPRVVPELDLPRPSESAPMPGNCQITVAEAGGEPRPWGWCQHHGRWLSLSLASGPNA